MKFFKILYICSIFFLISIGVKAVDFSAAKSIFADQNTSFGATTLTPGMTNVKVGSFILAASSSEDIHVYSITIKTNVVAYNLQNLKLMADGVQLWSTQAVLSSNQSVTFDGLPAIIVSAGGQKIIDVHADIKTNADTGLYGPVTTLAGCSGAGLTSASAVGCLPTNIAGQAISVYRPELTPDRIKVMIGYDSSKEYILGADTVTYEIGKLLNFTGVSKRSGGDLVVADPANPYKSNLKITKNGTIYLNYDVSASSGDFAVWGWTPKEVGIYQVALTVDSKNEISESNESNNTFEKTITVGDSTAKPDLTPDRIRIMIGYDASTEYTLGQDSAPHKAGKLLNFTVTTKNLGGSYTYTDRLAPFKMILNITKNGTAYLNQEGSASSGGYNIWGWTPKEVGVYTVKLIVDSGSEVAESDESNNTLSKTITIVSAPGVTTVKNIITRPVTDTSINIIWDTGYAGNTKFYFRKDGGYDDQNTKSIEANCYNKSFSISRECQVVLGGLVPGGIYFYKFQEGDVTGSYISYFVMPTKLNNSDIGIKDITDNSAVITWSTSAVLNGKIVYYPSKNLFDQKTVSDPNFVSSHSLKLENLKPATKYTLQITSLDAEGGGKISDDLNFTTLPNANALPDLTVKDVYFSPSIPIVGKVFNGELHVKVANIGQAETAYSNGVMVAVALSSDWVLYNWNNNGVQYADNIAAGSVKDVVFKLNYVKFTAAPMEIRVWLDSNAIGDKDNLNNDNLFIKESNENNNTLIKKITLRSGTDITPVPSGDLLNINLDKVALNSREIESGFKITNFDYNSFDPEVTNSGAAKPKQYIQETFTNYYANPLSQESHTTGLRLYDSVEKAKAIFDYINTRHTRKIIELSQSEKFGDDIFCHTSPDFSSYNKRDGKPDIYYYICGFRYKNAFIFIQSTITDDSHDRTLSLLKKYYYNLTDYNPNRLPPVPGLTEEEIKNSRSSTYQPPLTEKTEDPQIKDISDNAKLLRQDKFDQILFELKQLRDLVKEQAVQIKYLNSLVKDSSDLSNQAISAINNFITYGVDDNTKKLGQGERAAVINSYKSAFDKLPESEAELADAIKIANGRFPSIVSDEAEQTAKEQFLKIYKRVPDLNNANDTAAVKVMAYGLRQKAANRNLNSEKTGIKTFTRIFGHGPKTTEDWNAMQAITYSGAARKPDTDKDGLADETEQKLGTNPNNADTDKDGYKDGEEVLNGYDPKTAAKKQ